MLYIFVDSKRETVLYATYDYNMAKGFIKYKTVKLAVKYFDDVEIYEVLDNDN